MINLVLVFCEICWILRRNGMYLSAKQNTKTIKWMVEKNNAWCWQNWKNIQRKRQLLVDKKFSLEINFDGIEILGNRKTQILISISKFENASNPLAHIASDIFLLNVRTQNKKKGMAMRQTVAPTPAAANSGRPAANAPAAAPRPHRARPAICEINNTRTRVIFYYKLFCLLWFLRTCFINYLY